MYIKNQTQNLKGTITHKHKTKHNIDDEQHYYPQNK